ncbi:MAG: class I SAM-dependent methyltransferase [Parvibaculum sp.]|uniref:class I SAM-dependent methyltransferase n=1 Tax=Parvibaculum sp. TaxID=2024848 RepID=UPI0025E28D3B|nr:class I SAM-dependent methyltransferase [Parvibaculum sp.]MCE9648093.1 class I SAM-dependent methyltransferase [Parvibaculum sp.]
MHESSKSVFYKVKDSRYATRYLVGQGIDIGAGRDSIGQYAEFFPLMKSCKPWDLPDGDAQLMETVADHTFDFIHSAHCLEHMRDAHQALENWLRILKPGGHLVCIVPDEDLYEQGVFPSTFNPDHKHTFTIHKKKSWSPVSINVTEMLANVKHKIEIRKIELMDATYRYQLNKNIGQPRFDQTLTPVGECAIEFIVKKLPA